MLLKESLNDQTNTQYELRIRFTYSFLWRSHFIRGLMFSFDSTLLCLNSPSLSYTLKIITIADMCNDTWRNRLDSFNWISRNILKYLTDINMGIYPYPDIKSKPKVEEMAINYMGKSKNISPILSKNLSCILFRTVFCVTFKHYIICTFIYSMRRKAASRRVCNYDVYDYVISV